MKKLLLSLFLLPFLANAQVNTVLQKTVSTGTIRSFSAGSAGTDTLAAVRLTGVIAGQSLIYNSTTKKFHATSLGISNITSLQDSLAKKANLTFDNVAVGAINVSKLTGILPIVNGGTGSATQNFVDLTTNQTVIGLKTFDNLSARSQNGGTLGIGLNIGYNYSTAGQPKTLMDFYGFSAVNGAVDFNSYTGTGTNKITPLSWKANGSLTLLDTITIKSADNSYKATLHIGRDTSSGSPNWDYGGLVLTDSTRQEFVGHNTPSFWLKNKNPVGYTGIGFRNSTNDFMADIGTDVRNLYFRSSSDSITNLVIALHPSAGFNKGFMNMNSGRIHFGGFLGLTMTYRSAFDFVDNTFTVGDTINTTSNALQVHGNGKADMGSLVLRSPSYVSTITGQATADRTIKFQNKSYTVADSADVAAISGGISGTTNYIPIFTGTNTLGNSNWIQSGYMITPNNNSNQLTFSGNTTLIGSAIVLPGGSGTNADAPTIRMGNTGKTVATMQAQSGGVGIGFLAYASDHAGLGNIKRYGTIGIDGKWYIGNDDGSTVTYGSHKFTVASAGNLGIALRNGTSSDRFQFYVGDGTGGTVADENYIINSNTDLNVTNTGGGVQLLNGATSWSAISDMRFKTKLSDLPSVLPDIAKNHPFLGYYNANPSKKPSYMLSAQELQTTFPSVVDVGNDLDQTLSVKYTELIPVLFKAIQEQQVIIEKLNQRITLLENK